MHGVLVEGIARVVVDLRNRRVDRELVEVGPAEAQELRVLIREEPALQQRIIREVDAGHDVRGAERDLLGLGEEVVGVAVQHESPDRRQRHELLGHDLRRIEDVEREAIRLPLGEELEAKLPLGIRAGLDRLPQVAAVEVRIGAGDLHGLVPHERVRPGDGLPVELAEDALAVGVHQPKRVHAEALHHAIAPRNRAIGHRPHEHVGRLRHERYEVPEGVVRGRRLRHGEVRLGLGRMDQIRELDRVLNEEDGHVVSDEVPVALLGVELDGEAADVARGVGRPALADDGREAHEDGRSLADLGEGRRLRVLGDVGGALEVAVRGRAARVDDALGDALVVEVHHLLAEDEVLEQRRPAHADLGRALVVRDRRTLVRREHPAARIDAHALERSVVAIRAGCGRVPELVGDVRLGERAGRRGGIGGRARRAGPRRASGPLAVLPGLQRIARNGGGHRLGRRHLVRQAAAGRRLVVRAVAARHSATGLGRRSGRSAHRVLCRRGRDRLGPGPTVLRLPVRMPLVLPHARRDVARRMPSDPTLMAVERRTKAPATRDDPRAVPQRASTKL